MAAEASRSSGAADSYLGSLISLTSKFEIRYEGILYNINTEESSIGLRNVRSFGTEGRKKDGQQVPPNDKVYEYILFRGTDIQDLQVISSPPVQTAVPIHNDPAIIQSHYSQPASVSTTLPTAVSGPVTDPNSHTAQVAVPSSTFHGSLPLYQPGGSLGSWGSPPPPNANGSGVAMPMYWQGFYGPSNGLSHVQQQSLLRPPPGLSMSHSMQQPIYPGISAPIPTGSSNLPAPNLPAPNFSAPNLPASNFSTPNLPASNAPNLSASNFSSPNLSASNFSAPNLPASNAPNLSASNFSAPSLPASYFREIPAPLLPPVSSGSANITTSTPQSTMLPAHSVALGSNFSPTVMSNIVPSAVPSTASLSTSLPLVSPLSSSSLDLNATTLQGSKPMAAPILSLPYQTRPHYVSPIMGTSSSNHSETSTPPLLTPGQLLQPGTTTLSSAAKKDVKVVQASPSEPPPSALRETQAPILPLPSQLPNQKLNGPPLHTHYHRNNRGRERGRGNGFSRPVTKFTEEFDFMAMNEKFKKDEVWGHLGKTNMTKNKEGDGKDDDGDVSQDEDDTRSSKLEKPVYVKDDFFDSLSCNALDNGQRHGRTKFSEQMKIDSETFGDFPRHRGGRGGRWPGRGGRSHGSYYGRGYGYVGRGRGYNN